jgi:ssDNA-binding Zn-finger/Zn-ribbon topoisomerase 1
MTSIAGRLVAYEIDRCPHCGESLNPPDSNLDRWCPYCRYTVMAATETIEVVDAQQPPSPP